MGFAQFIKKHGWPDSAILIAFVLAFTVATGNHVMDQVRGGPFPYDEMYGASKGFNLYWSSLTVLDPLAIIALLFNVRMGYTIALGIMFTDVPVNLYATVHYWRLSFHENPFLLMQAAFLLFLLLTVRRVWILSKAGPG